MPHLPKPSAYFRHWNLDPEVVYLNHGSFGACPREVLAAQDGYRAQMEREPVRYFVEEFQGLMDRTRRDLGAFLGCAWDEIAPVPNATVASATVFDDVNLRAGDEILINEHEYPACQNNARRAAARAGASVVTTAMPFPIAGPQQIVDAILGKVTSRTRVVMVSHVTSPTGLVMPVERLVAELEPRGVRVFVDGAHAPGMVATLNLGTLGASYYTANCHKWICSPKGGAFLYVRRDRQEGFRPLVLSNNAEKPKAGRAQFLTEFDFVGTADYTGFFAISDALRVMREMVPGGWTEIMRRNHEMAVRGRDIVCAELGITPAAPREMLGSIVTMILPAHEPERLARVRARPSAYHDALQDALIRNHRIQVPVWGLAGKPERFVRISAQVYNSEEQYVYLAKALKAELEAEARM